MEGASAPGGSAGGAAEGAVEGVSAPGGSPGGAAEVAEEESRAASRHAFANSGIGWPISTIYLRRPSLCRGGEGKATGTAGVVASVAASAATGQPGGNLVANQMPTRRRLRKKVSAESLPSPESLAMASSLGQASLSSPPTGSPGDSGSPLVASSPSSGLAASLLQLVPYVQATQPDVSPGKKDRKKETAERKALIDLGRQAAPITTGAREHTESLNAAKQNLAKVNRELNLQLDELTDENLELREHIDSLDHDRIAHLAELHAVKRERLHLKELLTFALSCLRDGQMLVSEAQVVQDAIDAEGVEASLPQPDETPAGSLTHKSSRPAAVLLPEEDDEVEQSEPKGSRVAVPESDSEDQDEDQVMASADDQR